MCINSLINNVRTYHIYITHGLGKFIYNGSILDDKQQLLLECNQSQSHKSIIYCKTAFLADILLKLPSQS